MAHHTVVVSHVTSRAEEDTAGMHQFAKREVNQQYANQCQVDVEHHADFAGHRRMETYPAHRQLFNAGDVGMG